MEIFRDPRYWRLLVYYLECMASLVTITGERRIFPTLVGVTHVTIKPDEWSKLMIPLAISKCAGKEREQI